jgi:hypothetical protein
MGFVLQVKNQESTAIIEVMWLLLLQKFCEQWKEIEGQIYFRSVLTSDFAERILFAAYLFHQFCVDILWLCFSWY